MLKNNKTVLALEQAKALILKEQGLLQSKAWKGKKGVLSAIDQLGYIQIDTLNVITRSHHHTLWCRLPDYKEIFLNELLEKDKCIFEYWSHAASYLPMSDYRFTLPLKKVYAQGKSHWFEQNKKINKYVLDKIKAEGPLQSKDFEFKRSTPGNWYNWKPAKQALEQLFMEGKLMVCKRHNFQKVYDLTDRVLPSTINTSFPSTTEFASFLIQKAVRANGIISENEITYLRKGLKEHIQKEVKRMLKEGELLQLQLEKQKDHYLTTVEKIQSMEVTSKKESVENIHILSPFDNTIIQRKRLKNIFDFDYNIECYLPASKRKYGYLCLPILFNNVFVGRFDPKADRISKTFFVKSIHFEKGFSPTTVFNFNFASKLKAFAAFNGCDKIVIQKGNNAWKKKIASLL